MGVCRKEPQKLNLDSGDVLDSLQRVNRMHTLAEDKKTLVEAWNPSECIILCDFVHHFDKKNFMLVCCLCIICINM